ncbi:MAG: hypothetical protein ACKVH0_04975 [Alphaproteobacteria bacterium]|jgi:hypothetical protein
MHPMLKTKFVFRLFVVSVILICAYCTYYAGAPFLLTVLGLGSVALVMKAAVRFGWINGRVEYEFDVPEDRRGGKLKP